MGIYTDINTAIGQMVLPAPLNITYGVDSEINIYADDTAAGGTMIAIYPIVNNFTHTNGNNFTDTYTISMLWATLETFDKPMEDREAGLVALENYAKEHIIKLEAVLQGTLVGGGITTGSAVGSFNLFDANLDGVLVSFEVTVRSKISC